MQLWLVLLQMATRLNALNSTSIIPQTASPTSIAVPSSAVPSNYQIPSAFE